MMAPVAEKVKKTWSEAGREGKPRLVALSYFALGPNAKEDSSRYLRDYYGWLGQWADQIAESASTTPDDLKALATSFEDLGVDELILDPTISELDQIGRLADALL